MTRARAIRRLAAGAVALTVTAGTTLLIAGPASAAAGDAATVGAAAEVHVHIGGVIDFDEANALGALAVSNPGEDAEALGPQTLIGNSLASITVDGTDNAVQSNDSVAQAASLTLGTSANLFGVSLVELDSAAAAVRCPVDASAQAIVDASGLRILGTPIDFDPGVPGYTETATLPADVAVDGVGTVDLSGLEITVAVTQVQLADSAQAVGIALAAAVTIEGTFAGDAVPVSTVASLVLAGASCEAPGSATPLTATGITPASGTAAGGETVTITGTGFVPGTLVDFGGVAATAVSVDPAGTSLTAVTPAGTAGDVVVTIANPSGTTATLAYTYVAVPTPPTPTPVVPAGDGTTALAATGLDAAPQAAGAALLLALGAAFTLLRRRSRSA